MDEFIEALIRTTPFITCETGNGYRVVMRFSRIDDAQEIHRLLCKAIIAYQEARSPAPPATTGPGPA